MSEKSAITSWVNNSKRFSLYVDNTEKSIYHGIDDEITNEWIELSRASYEGKLDVIRRILHLRTSYQDITKKLQNPNLYHATNFQQMLETFECKLSSFKQAMRTDFDSLELSEHVQSNDLVSILLHFEKLSQENVVTQVRSDAKSKNSVLEKQQKDMKKKAVIGGLDRKIAHLGRFGGWDARDHDVFIKIWNQAEMKINYNGEFTIRLVDAQRELLLNKLKFNLPAHNNTEIDEHINWYVSFLELNAAKKRTVEEWKNDTTRNRTNINQSTLVNEILKDSESIDDINLDGGCHGGKNRASSEKEEEVRQAAKQRIRAWRAEKATQQQLEKENQRKQALLSRKDQEHQSQQRQQSARIQLEKWKKSEELNKEVLDASKKCMGQPKSVDPALLRMWQERDLENAKNKHAKVEKVSQRQMERIRRQKKAAAPSVQNDVARDSNRLRAPTVASEAAALTADELDAAEYRRENVGAHGSAMALTGRDLSTLGRAVPIWMKHG